jgi:hypothetical protein
MQLDKTAFTSLIVSVISFDDGIVKKPIEVLLYEVKTLHFEDNVRPSGA